MPRKVAKTLIFAGLVCLAPLSVSAVGQGYFEFSVPTTTQSLEAGLDSAPSPTGVGVDFGWRFTAPGLAEVRESGTYRVDTAYASNDVFRVESNDGYMTYSRNGTLVYTSFNTATYPLFAQASLWSAESGIGNAKISYNEGGLTEDVNWIANANATTTGGTIRKTGGCSGCADAGGVSSQSITAGVSFTTATATLPTAPLPAASGEGSASFTVADANLEFAVGLSASSTTTPAASVNTIQDYAVRIHDGVADVREKGSLKASAALSASDTIEVSVIGNQVLYSRNGFLFHTSDAAPQLPMYAMAALFDLGSGISASSIAVYDGNTLTTAPIIWTGISEPEALQINGSALTKIMPPCGCVEKHPIAVSSQSIFMSTTTPPAPPPPPPPPGGGGGGGGGSSPPPAPAPAPAPPAPAPAPAPAPVVPPAPTPTTTPTTTVIVVPAGVPEIAAEVVMAAALPRTGASTGQITFVIAAMLVPFLLPRRKESS